MEPSTFPYIAGAKRISHSPYEEAGLSFEELAKNSKQTLCSVVWGVVGEEAEREGYVPALLRILLQESIALQGPSNPAWGLFGFCGGGGGNRPQPPQLASFGATWMTNLEVRMPILPGRHIFLQCTDRVVVFSQPFVGSTLRRSWREVTVAFCPSGMVAQSKATLLGHPRGFTGKQGFEPASRHIQGFWRMPEN